MRGGCGEVAKRVRRSGTEGAGRLQGVKGLLGNRPAGLRAAGRGSRGAPRSPGTGRRHPEPQPRSPGRPRPCSCSSQRRFPQGEPRDGARSPGDAAGLWDRCVCVCVCVLGGTTRQGSSLCPGVQGARLRDPLPKPLPFSPPCSLGVPGGGRAGEQPPGRRRSLPAGRRSTGSAAARRGSRKGSGDSQWLCRAAAGSHPWESPAPAPARDCFRSLLQGHGAPAVPTLRAAQAASLRSPFGKASCNPTVLGAVSEEKVLA